MSDIDSEYKGISRSRSVAQGLVIYRIAENMRILRLNRKLSQKQVAAQLGVSYQQLQKYETGRNRFPVEKLFTLKQLYKVPYDAFFRDVRLSPSGEGAEIHDLWRRLEGLGNPRRREQIENILMILLDEESQSGGG